MAGSSLLGLVSVAGLVAISGMALMAIGGGIGANQQGSCGASLGGASLAAGGEVVGASDYGGPGDPSSGTNGAYGSLPGHYAFAELSTNWAAPSGWNFSALGGLAPGTMLEISYGGRSVIAQKLDVGRGGPPVGQPPHARAIDLWWQTAQALGFSGVGLVSIAPAPPGTTTSASLVPGGQGQLTSPAAGSSGSAQPGGVGCSPASFLGGSAIVALANSQVGVKEHPVGSYCTTYGPCEEWCALFVTWVWRHAGVKVPTEAFTGAVYRWAAANGRVLPPSATPSPGDAVFFGSGPDSPATSLHMGIITEVTAGGEIVEVDGDYGHQVTRVGPYPPSQAALSGEPGPIYGYAQPVA